MSLATRSELPLGALEPRRARWVPSWTTFAGAAALSLTVQGPSLASPLTLVNPSFEAYVLADGTNTQGGVGLTGYGWTVTDVGSFQPIVGINNPAAGEYVGIPDGVNIAYSNGPIISQTLTDVLTANTSYTVTVGVGDHQVLSFGGYRVQLLAGGSVLAEDNNSLAPVNGGFVTSIVSFTALPGNPHLGEALEIRLISLGSVTAFDFARVDATPIPEPAVAALGIVGFVGLASYGTQARKRHRLPTSQGS